jgi:hypothetical protein
MTPSVGDNPARENSSPQGTRLSAVRGCFAVATISLAQGEIAATLIAPVVVMVNTSWKTA